MYPVDMLKVRDPAGPHWTAERRADCWLDEDAGHQPWAYRDIHKLHRQRSRNCIEG